MNIYTGLFITSVLRKEKYRFNFGRKWHKERIEKSLINLPSKNGMPDFNFMEKYMKSQPYSSALEDQRTEVVKHTKNQVGKSPNKGLDDSELIKKYGDLKTPFDKIVEKISSVRT